MPRPYRDLTQKFMDRRSRNGNNRRLSFDRSHEIEMGAVVLNVDGFESSRKPPDWMSYQSIRAEDLANIDFTINELKKLHAKKLLPTFDKKAEKKVNKAIAAKTQEYKKMAKAMTREIKRLDNTEYRTLEEQNLGSNMVNSLSKQLSDRSVQFANVNKSFVDKMNELAGGNNAFSSGRGNQEQKYDDIFATGVQLSGILERDTDIKLIFKSIQEIGEMFTDLHVLVVEQGTILDRVDYNLEVAMTQTFKGKDHLKKAVERNKKASSRTLWCTGVLTLANSILWCVWLYRL